MQSIQLRHGKNIPRPFRRDDRFVVRTGNDLRPRLDGQPDELLGGYLAEHPGSRFQIRIMQNLTGMPVLAEIAMEVAPEHTESQGFLTGEKMAEWLLLDRIDGYPRGITPRHA